MVRIGDAYIGGGVGGNVGDHIVIDPAVVGVQPQVHGDTGVELLKVRNGLLVDIGLGNVGIVLGPEGDLIAAAFVEGFRNGEGALISCPVAAGKQRRQGQGRKERGNYFFHPLVPPLATPAMIFLWKTRNRIMRGREMTTTAAIMAGMFSRPKPFSRISWIPLETR